MTVTDRSHRVASLKASLLDELADIMLTALQAEGRIYLHTEEHYKLKEALMEALDGKVRL